MTTQPTQVKHPFWTAFRTALQSIVGGFLGFAAVLFAVNETAPQILIELQPVLPEEWFAILTGFITTVGVLAGVVARIMVIPGVNNTLNKIHLGADPTGKDNQ